MPLAYWDRNRKMNFTHRFVRSAAAAALFLGGIMTPSLVSAETPEDSLKKLQSQIEQQTALLTALKAQASAQSDLDKAKAQGDFAKLAGIKAGLDSVGAPVGKEGNITVSTGTAGTLMLGLKKPMFEGLEESAAVIAKAVERNLPVYVGTDEQVLSAFQASATKEALEQETEALEQAINSVQPHETARALAVAPVLAATGLALNTLVEFGKFFRVDTAYSVFDASDEAQQVLMSMLEQKLGAKGDYRNLATVSINMIQEAHTSLDNLKQQYDKGVAAVAKAKNASDPLVQALNERLKSAKTMLDSLNPALKPDDFRAYAQGLAARASMRDKSGKYLNRLVVSVKAQTIQIVEKRTWRSDDIFGKSDIQVQYRLLDPAGKLLDYGLNLATYSKQGMNDEPAKSHYSFPSKP